MNILLLLFPLFLTLSLLFVSLFLFLFYIQEVRRPRAFDCARHLAAPRKKNKADSCRIENSKEEEEKLKNKKGGKNRFLGPARINFAPARSLFSVRQRSGFEKETAGTESLRLLF